MIHLCIATINLDIVILKSSIRETLTLSPSKMAESVKTIIEAVLGNQKPLGLFSLNQLLGQFSLQIREVIFFFFYGLNTGISRIGCTSPPPPFYFGKSWSTFTHKLRHFAKCDKTAKNFILVAYENVLGFIKV